jgi:hypothetical protein
MTDALKIIFAEVHMEEQALTWWQTYTQNLAATNQPPIDTWDNFKCNAPHPNFRMRTLTLD